MITILKCNRVAYEDAEFDEGNNKIVKYDS